MSEPSIDAVFAQFTDDQICIAWADSLSDIFESQGDHVLEDWPDSWRIAWVVVTYRGLWEGDGIASLWLSNQDHIKLFIASLEMIGAGHVSDYVSRSFAAVGWENVLNEAYCMGEGFHQLAKEWDRDMSFYTSGLSEYLASFLRRHRNEATPLCASISGFCVDRWGK